MRFKNHISSRDKEPYTVISRKPYNHYFNLAVPLNVGSYTIKHNMKYEYEAFSKAELLHE